MCQGQGNTFAISLASSPGHGETCAIHTEIIFRHDFSDQRVKRDVHFNVFTILHCKFILQEEMMNCFFHILGTELTVV
ncbi:hypothetical protein BDA96_01G368600 [Sorghum bicolor]|uniref:Uncharacterized protein n=2 Tax=Sorghum bicolor TaxID=4558 RepID=A0A921S2B5_SORBI|nr:hypothetical protein BDA96_01G368600 [Sorghum bicolor]OQU92444.1 hypothetical protein SORBI_3001G345366 [Sorghum bicolor]